MARQVRVAVCLPFMRPFVPARAGYPTIVPLAGIFERWEHLAPLMRHLNRIGFGVHVIPELGRNLGRVDDLADIVAADLERHDLRDVAFVAHSKGGLIGKVVLLRDVGQRVRHLVALSTPFKGSRLAALARDKELASLAPASRQMVKLSLRTEVDHRITSIFATYDEIIAVPTQVALGTNVEAIRVGHHTVLSSREVAEHVALDLARTFGLPPRLEPDRVPLASVLAGRKRDVLRDYGFAVGWQLRSLVPDARRRANWRRGAGGKPAIVLLPGVLERWHFLRAIGDRLHRAGYPVHAITSLGINRANAPLQAARVAGYLVEHDLRDVVLVAHSKGGLIGKLTMLDRAVADRVRGMVTVASPFNGSPYARFFVDPSIREFSPKHPVIVGLGRERDVNAKIVSIWPAFDQHIPTTSRLPGAYANIEVPGTGHFRILSSRVVIDAVQRYVGVLERGDEVPGAVNENRPA